MITQFMPRLDDRTRTFGVLFNLPPGDKEGCLDTILCKDRQHFIRVSGRWTIVKGKGYHLFARIDAGDNLAEQLVASHFAQLPKADECNHENQDGQDYP